MTLREISGFNASDGAIMVILTLIADTHARDSDRVPSTEESIDMRVP